jgi:hypothetical protein
MTAPTEADIREAIAARATLWPNDNPRTALADAIEDFGSFMRRPVHLILDGINDVGMTEADEADVWTDLRPSEALDLERIYREAVEEAKEAVEAAIVDVMVAAALRFAEAHPDAPRAKVAQPV